MAASLAKQSSRAVHVLRRPDRSGGKAGVVNYVLRRIAATHPLVLLCDNDSIALDADAIQRALPAFDDETVAAVQFRNVGVAGPSDGFVNQTLSAAVEVFDLFAVHQARHGLMPFLGHNGILRTAAVTEVGGVREGCFSDDIDLSARLALSGKRVRYARDIVFGERHPSSYDSFRRRAFKWAFGCGQVLRRQLVPVLRSRELTFAEKLGFAEFTTFYLAQVALLAYLVIAWILLPLVADDSGDGGAPSWVGSSVLAAAIFLPGLSYYLSSRRPRAWWPFAWICALVYGGAAFATARGVLAGLRDRPRPWVPTNVAPPVRSAWPALVLEASFGAALFAIPAVMWRDLALEPGLYLFVSVFLLAPLIALRYQPVAAGEQQPAVVAAHVPRSISRFLVLIVAAFLGTLLLGTGRLGAPAEPRSVEIRGRDFWVNGSRIQVKGLHYSPWPPGTGPMKSYPWPDGELVAKDLGLIKDLGVNTVLVHDAPPELLDRAAERDLLVLYTFFLNWQSISDDAIFEKRAAEIVAVAGELAKRKNLLGILLGNEVVEWVYKKEGRQFVERRLRSLFDRIKAVSPNLPVSHANWPITKGLDLSFMDFAAFNLYPAWPREVVLQGYGNYIQEILLPAAGTKPLLITEFGQNSLEVSEVRQSEVLRESWKEIAARTAGGVVFEFADEWWKNYDNPIEEGDWWKREYAPDDEKTHDLDPEEYYGLFSASRAPKPASAVVRAMFAEPRASGWRYALYGAPLLLIVAYTVAVFLRRPRAARGSSAHDHGGSAPTLTVAEMREPIADWPGSGTRREP